MENISINCRIINILMILIVIMKIKNKLKPYLKTKLKNFSGNT